MRMLLVAGPFVSRDLDARRRLALLDAPGVLRLPYLAERDFWRAARPWMPASICAIPAAGETSGIAIRLMGIGKPVLLTAGEENSRFPEPPLVCASSPAWRKKIAVRPHVSANIDERMCG